MAKIRIAIIGVGNCASSLIQGIEFYRRAEGHDPIPGLMHLELGGYHVGDIDCVAAFDVAKGKVGRDLADALQAPPNNTIRFADLRPTGVEVRRGPTHDGIGQYLRDVIEESPAAPDNVAKTLRAAGAEIVVSYLPVGSEAACAGMPSRRSPPVAPSSTASLCSSPRTRVGATSSRSAACR